MFKIFPKLLFLFCFILFAATSDSFAGTKIAVIDFDRIVEESKAFKSLDKNVKKAKNRLVSEIKATDSKLLEQKKEVFEDKDEISEEDFVEKAQDYNKTVSKNKVRFGNKKKRITSAVKRANNHINIEIKNIVKVLAKKKGFDIAIAKSATSFASSDLDITDEVIRRLDKKITNVDIKK